MSFAGEEIVNPVEHIGKIVDYLKAFRKKRKKTACHSSIIWYNNINDKNHEIPRRNGIKVFKEYDQNQSYLLPPSLNEEVGPEHSARVISDVVESIDISPITSKYNGGGPPAYHPRMMLKLIIYAYSQCVYSSRRIERALESDAAFMYLSGMQRPDFRTICLFRATHCETISKIFVEIVRLCATLGMVELGHVSFDGTKLKANASIKQMKDKKAVQKEMMRGKRKVKGEFLLMCIVHNIGKIISKIQAQPVEVMAVAG